MPTIVGGWLKAKKRGRDDDAIERDRQEAMTKRRQRRKRQRRSTKDDFDRKSPPVSTKRSGKCSSPRIPLSCVPRRELFPNKKPSQRVARTERKTERKSYPPLKQHNEKNEHSEAFKTKFSIQNFSTAMGKGKAPQSNIVTPIENSEDLCSKSHSTHHQRIPHTNNKRHKIYAKIFARGEEMVDDSPLADVPHRSSNSPKRRLFSSPSPRTGKVLKEKPRKLQKCDFYLRPKLDFVRSARILRETIRQRKSDPEKDMKVSTIKALADDETTISTGAKLSAKVIFEGPSFTGGGDIMKKQKTQRETQSENIRNILLGTSNLNSTNSKGGSDSTDKNKNIDRGHDTAFENRDSPWVEENLKGTTDFTSTSESLTETKSRRSYELQQLSTQQEDQNGNQPWNSTSGPKVNTLVEIGTDAPISLPRSQRIGKKVTELPVESENLSPSQTPSTSSSAVLCLPMNDIFASSQFSMKSNRSNQDKSVSSLKHTTLDQSLIRKMDPLRDIEFWQRIVEKEETRKNVVGGRSVSFKHAIANLILAKNDSRARGKEKFRCDGFLWLPSILEGGLKHTGLIDDEYQE